MGFRNTWVAVEGPLTRVLASGGWGETGDTSEWLEVGLYGLVLPGGWALVVGSGWDHIGRVTTRHAAALGDALFLTQDDTSMTATLLAFRGGRARWSIAYDGSDGVAQPVFSGDLPPEFEAVWKAHQDAQTRAGGPKAGVDHHYGLVPELGRVLIGFRHDQDPPDGCRFRTLR